MQAQQATRCLQVEVIMRPTLAQRRLVAAREAQTARHAQVHEQQAFAQVQQQILAASAHPQHHPADQRLRLQAQRPAQGLSQGGGFNLRARNTVCKRAARDLDFG
jgi:hypothetical protein